MPTGIQTNYAGSPLMGGGSSDLTLVGWPGATGPQPTATPSGGIGAGGFGLETPDVGDLSLAGASGRAANIDAAGLAVGGALQVGSTALQGVLQNQQIDDQRRLARELADMQRADEWASFSRQHGQQQAGMGLAAQGQKAQQKDASLEVRHNRFMRAFQRASDRNAQAQGLMENVGGMIRRDSNMRRKLIQGWATT